MSSVFDKGPVQLNSCDAMFAVLKELTGPTGLGWRGSVEAWGDEATGEVKWRLHLNDDKGNKIRSLVDLQDGVHMGEWLVLTYGRLLVLDPSEV